MATMRRIMQLEPGFYAMTRQEQLKTIALFFAREETIKRDERQGRTLCQRCPPGEPTTRRNLGTDRDVVCSLCSKWFSQYLFDRGGYVSVEHVCSGLDRTNAIWLHFPRTPDEGLAIQQMGFDACVLYVWLRAVGVLGEVVYPHRCR